MSAVLFPRDVARISRRVCRVSHHILPSPNLGPVPIHTLCGAIVAHLAGKMTYSLFQLPDELILAPVLQTFPCRERQIRSLATLLHVRLAPTRQQRTN